MKPNAGQMIVNVPDVALIFEGGGMRASYTAAVVVTLLEQQLYFSKVYGISAGSSHVVNYASRDIPRAKASFVDLVNDPKFGGMKTFLQGKGFFNAHYLYEGNVENLVGTGDVFEFDLDAFLSNPAEVHIEGFDWDTGETIAWTKKDMQTLRDIMLRVRASSTMPIFMPPVTFGGRTYMDGGMGSSWGILLDAARRDGFKRFFVVRTQPRGYRKKEPGKAEQAFFRFLFRKHPKVAENTLARWKHYNALCDELERLEGEGTAYVFYPEEMSISNKETNFSKLEEAFNLGYAQAQKELPVWKNWLGL